MAEVPPETMERAYVVVDDVDAAAAGDLIRADRAPNATIGDLLAGRAPAIGEDVTVFKSVGIASQDVAAAEWALRRAVELDLGVVLKPSSVLRNLPRQFLRTSARP